MADISLYPPIFNKPYMPAFIGDKVQSSGDDGCDVYFSISAYNSLNDLFHYEDKIEAIQVSVRNQKTNQSVLNQPSEIILKELRTKVDQNGKTLYYIKIRPNDIEGGFQCNQYYKVQIRFTSIQADPLPRNNKEIDYNQINSWLSSNLSHFSEWSTVVLIRPISTPKLILNGFDMESDSNTFTFNDIIISGRIKFENDNDQETLRNYQIRIYDESDNLLEDSGEIQLNSYSNVNQIYYKCKYDFEDQVEYKLGVQILTQNLYSWKKEQIFHFQVQTVVYTTFEAEIEAKPENEAGRIKIHLTKNQFSVLGTNITIRRSSSKDNFKIWEDVRTFLVPANSILDYTWYDYTVENGIWYLYSAQQRNAQGFKSTSIKIIDPVMIVSEDIFLATGQGQLKIRFNPQVTNFSHTVSQSLTQTIGSKYPFIRRNGNVNYRTFTLSGTITHFMDIRQNLMHASKQDLYQQNASLYERYNDKNNINLYNDVTYEKDFRKKVMDFLYKNDVKLYKSATEGSMLVKLMNISFTPNTTLSRQIYDFTCTAYEIDEFNYDNCVKYNIQDKGSYQDQTNYLFSVLGQINRPVMSIYYKKENEEQEINYEDRLFSNQQSFGTEELISNSITKQYQKFETDILAAEVAVLTYLKIELTSKPYLIGIDNNGNPYKISDESQEGLFVGHIALINDQYIIIGKDGIYELADEDTNITSLSFISQGETGTLSYEAIIKEKAKDERIPKEYSNLSKIGQCWGFFDLNNSVYRKILNRYNQSYSFKVGTTAADLYEQQVMSINGIRVQADPGTVFYVKEFQDSDFQKHVIGPSGLLEFYDENTNIQGIYFVGPKLRQSQQTSSFDTLYEDYAEEDEFIQTGLVFNTFDEIKRPIRNGVYTIVDTNREADISQRPSPGWKPLPEYQQFQQFRGLTNQDLAALTELAAPAQTQDGIKVSDKIKQYLDNNGYLNNTLTILEKQLFVSRVYQAILRQFFDSQEKENKRYIYYKGDWYPFGNDNVIQVPFVQAIVDYYCKLVRKRY